VLVSNLQDAPVDAEGLATLAARTLEGEGRRNVELSLSFVSPAQIEDLLAGLDHGAVDGAGHDRRHLVGRDGNRKLHTQLVQEVDHRSRIA